MALKMTGDEEERVRCWDCSYRSLSLKVPIWRGTPIRRRACRFGLGYDPFILRRCSRFLLLPAQFREPVPPEYRQGAKAPQKAN